MINIVIPMAGEGIRFVNAGYKKPKPFIDVAGKAMIERVIENLQCLDARFILIGRKEHLKREYEFVNYLKKRFDAIFLEIDNKTEGTACTVLYARKYINNNEPLLIANSDQIVDIKIQSFIDDFKLRELDGSILTFSDLEQNPKWSFAKIDNKGLVIEVQEKKVISEFATVGIYLFKSGKDFVNYSLDMIVRNIRVNNEFYTCPVYNHAIEDFKKIGIYNILQSEMNGIGTPEDLNLYLKKLNNV
ncbi:glycosyltransferase family 2 protein [Aquirufa lenticrescens]|uniref:glycosyltransferase family 2 protein n=1 Tax=Aquirufa lenticrescens TaxID=2696560 RepID=UPI001CAA8189|nr:glycosyltransferase family 2 protein [Aquirufa lenticrescens]